MSKLHNPLEPDPSKPLKLKWLWEEKLAAVVVVLWLLAEAFAIYYITR